MINYLGLSSLSRLIEKIKAYIKDAIQQQFNHTVIGKNTIVTAKSNHGQLNEYVVQCNLGGAVLKVMSLYDISNIEVSNPRKVTWTKTAYQTSCYAGIFLASSTAGSGVLRLTIKNTETGGITYHYLCFIEDTPKQGTFLFCTTCDWNFITKYKNDSNARTHTLQCLLEVPDDFVGNISIECIRGTVKSGGQWYVTKPSSESDTTPAIILNFLNGTSVYNDGETIVDVPFFNVPDINGYKDISSTDFITPFGKHTVDLIYDFDKIEVGDKISDLVINDVILHNLVKSYNSSIENYNSKIKNLEERIKALEP